MSRASGPKPALGGEQAFLQCPKCLTRLSEPGNFCPSCGEDLRGLTPTSDTLSGAMVGRTIDDRYRLVEKLGEGGMGAVYKVEHVRMGKVLALKLLRPDLAIDKKMKQRFHQEARVVSKLSHPNTIQVFDFGELEDGSLYIAMEFLPGRDLAWTLRAHGSFTEERAIAIGIQVLSSLAEAHELGIVHRDIKPANVMLMRRKDGGDTVKVLDFGIAKLNEGEARKHITGVADFVGTPAYMSPEQARGEELDARSDLYSVAAMLFELVAGRGVFDGPTPMSIVSKHMSEPPPRFAQVAPEKIVSPGFESVVRKALSKDRNDRFKSADEMRLALEKARRDIAGSLADYTPVNDLNTAEMASREDFEEFERALRRRRALLPVSAVLVLVALAVGGWQAWRHLRAEQIFTAEREPNNEPQRATPVPLGADVSGMIGTAISEHESDRDFFVIDVPRREPLTIEVGGVPDMNLVVDVFHGDGETEALAASSAAGGQAKIEEKLKRLVSLDDGRTGAGERVDGVHVEPGRLYVRIYERAHGSEGLRPPRETTKAEYVLTVRPTQGDDRLEHEPDNDKPETAAIASVDRAIRAFTGTAIPQDAPSFEKGLSAVDVFRVDEGSGAKVFAIVVPPEKGRLSIFDETAVEAWRTAVASAARVVTPPSAVEASGAPVLVPLREGKFGHAVRVQPYWPGAKNGDVDPNALLRDLTPPGSAYYVAFLSDRDDGLKGAYDVLSLLDASGHSEQREKLIEEIRRALKSSPRLAAFNEGLPDPVANVR